MKNVKDLKEGYIQGQLKSGARGKAEKMTVSTRV